MSQTRSKSKNKKHRNHKTYNGTFQSNNSAVKLQSNNSTKLFHFKFSSKHLKTILCFSLVIAYVVIHGRDNNQLSSTQEQQVLNKGRYQIQDSQVIKAFLDQIDALIFATNTVNLI
jgi:hypothetical protein